MLIISQHARLINIPFPKNTIFRLNAAWIKSKNELYKLLSEIKGDVFLDFPKGRSKPPIPVLELGDLIQAMLKFKKIKYFAITNVKSPQDINDIRHLIPTRIILIPKIESKIGINKFELIINKLKRNEKYIMLDKEDLYTDLDNNNEKFEEYLQLIRNKCLDNSIECLELQGVIFSDSTY